MKEPSSEGSFLLEYISKILYNYFNKSVGNT